MGSLAFGPIPLWLPPVSCGGCVGDAITALGMAVLKNIAFHAQYGTVWRHAAHPTQPVQNHGYAHLSDTHVPCTHIPTSSESYLPSTAHKRYKQKLFLCLHKRKKYDNISISLCECTIKCKPGSSSSCLLGLSSLIFGACRKNHGGEARERSWTLFKSLRIAPLWVGHHAFLWRGVIYICVGLYVDT